MDISDGMGPARSKTLNSTRWVHWTPQQLQLAVIYLHYAAE